MLSSRSSPIAQYRNVYTSAAMGEVDAHTLVSKLMGGVIDCATRAMAHIEHHDIAGKGESISRAISILNALRAALDHNVGGELSANLEALYEYMSRRLFEANANSDLTTLGEVAGLMRTVKSGWDEIPQADRKLPPRPQLQGR